MTLNEVEIQLNDLPSPLLFEIFTLGTLLNNNNKRRSHQNSLLTLRLVCQDWNLIIQSELKKLSFQSCVCPSATIALQMVSKFPHLQSLSLKDFRDLTTQHFTTTLVAAASSSSSFSPSCSSSSSSPSLYVSSSSCSSSSSSSFSSSSFSTDSLSSPPIRSLRLKNVHLTNDILIAMIDHWSNTLQDFSLTSNRTDNLTQSFLHLIRKCGSSLRSLHFTPQSFSFSTIKEFVKTCSNGLLKELTWPGPFSFQQDPIWHLLPKVLKTNPNLRSICFHSLEDPGFNNDSEEISIVFEWLAKYCPELEHCTMKFMGAVQLNEKEQERVERFAMNCKKLKSLTVSGCIGLDSYHPFAVHGKQLETLCTGEIPFQYEVDHLIELCVLNGCTQLKTLRFSDDHFERLVFDTKPFYNLQTTERLVFEQCERIEELILEFPCYILQFYEMVNLPCFAGLPNLKTLALTPNYPVNSQEFPSLPIAFFQRCPSLKKLFLKDIEYELFPLFEKCSQLTDVTLHLDQTSIQVLVSLANNCPQLRCIDVSSALYRKKTTSPSSSSSSSLPDMTKGFVSLIRNCSQLEVIRFTKESVSTAGLMEMATSPSLNRLKSIALGGSKFTDQVLEALVNRRPLFPLKKICLFNNRLREDLLKKTLATFPHLHWFSTHADPSLQWPTTPSMVTPKRPFE